MSKKQCSLILTKMTIHTQNGIMIVFTKKVIIRIRVLSVHGLCSIISQFLNVYCYTYSASAL